jgi:hypothetical protein
MVLASTAAQPTALSEDARGAVGLFFDGLLVGLVAEGERCVRSQRADYWAREGQSRVRAAANTAGCPSKTLGAVQGRSRSREPP